MTVLLMTRVPLIATVMMLTGCMAPYLVTYQATVLEPIDPTDRTITVPQGRGLTRAISAELAKRGWQVQVQGAGSDRTRYSLGLRWQEDVIHHCLIPFEPKYKFEMVLGDNVAGRAVITAWGGACEGKIVGDVMHTLETGK